MTESQKLINMEITREEIISKSEYEVDSTTEETPVKKPKIIKDSKSKKVKTKKETAKARIDAVKGRAREMFAALSSESESEEVKQLKQEVHQLKSKLKTLTPPEKPGKRVCLSSSSLGAEIDEIY